MAGWKHSTPGADKAVKLKHRQTRNKWQMVGIYHLTGNHYVTKPTIEGSLVQT